MTKDLFEFFDSIKPCHVILDLLEKRGTVTVCSACYRASCWQGRLYCDDYKKAGTEEKTIDELKQLALENECYWETHISA